MKKLILAVGIVTSMVGCARHYYYYKPETPNAQFSLDELECSGMSSKISNGHAFGFAGHHGAFALESGPSVDVDGDEFRICMRTRGYDTRYQRTDPEGWWFGDFGN